MDQGRIRTNKGREIMRDQGSVRSRSMRDTSPAGRNASHNRITPAQSLRQFGWLAPALSNMAGQGRWAYSLNPDNDVIAGTGMPLEGMSTTPNALVNACEIAVAGASGKNFGSFAWPASPAAGTITLTTNLNATLFGVLVRISNSTNLFKFGTYEIQLENNGVVTGYVLIQAATLPVEVVILSINNNAGKGVVVPNPTPSVVIPYSATPGAIGNLNAGSFGTGDVIYAESLNMRDLGNIANAVDNGAILL